MKQLLNTTREILLDIPRGGISEEIEKSICLYEYRDKYKDIDYVKGKTYIKLKPCRLVQENSEGMLTHALRKEVGENLKGLEYLILNLEFKGYEVGIRKLLINEYTGEVLELSREEVQVARVSLECVEDLIKVLSLTPGWVLENTKGKSIESILRALVWYIVRNMGASDVVGKLGQRVTNEELEASIVVSTLCILESQFGLDMNLVTEKNLLKDEVVRLSKGDLMMCIQTSISIVVYILEELDLLAMDDINKSIKSRLEYLESRRVIESLGWIDKTGLEVRVDFTGRGSLGSITSIEVAKGLMGVEVFMRFLVDFEGIYKARYGSSLRYLEIHRKAGIFTEECEIEMPRLSSSLIVELN